MFFHVFSDTRPYKTTKSSIFLGFWEILGKDRSIFMKNGSRNLKSRYLRNTFLPSTFAVIELWSWNLAKLVNKLVQKNHRSHFFEFLIFNLIFSTIFAKMCNFGEYGAEYEVENQKFKRVTPVIFLDQFFLQLGQISAS